jgi:hypothetical protein
MSQYLYGNDDYENIPLMRGSNQQPPLAPTPTEMIKQHWKKAVIGFIVVVACVLLFSSSGNHHKNNSAQVLKVDGEALTLTPDVIEKDSVVEKPNFNSNYTDAEVNEEFLEQFKEVYPNADSQHFNADSGMFLTFFIILNSSFDQI